MSQFSNCYRMLTALLLLSFFNLEYAPLAHASVKYEDDCRTETGIDSKQLDRAERELIWGYIDRTGRYNLPPRYSVARDFFKGSACVKSEHKDFRIDRNGKTIPEPKDDALCCDEAVVPFHSDIYDASGQRKIVSKGVGAEVRHFTEGLAPCHLSSEIVKQFYPLIYKTSVDLSGRYGSFGYIDRRNRLVIEPKFYSAGFFQDGVAIADYTIRSVVSGKVYINRTGNVIGNHFSLGQLLPFSEGFGRFSNRAGSGFIDKKGKVLVSQLEDAGTFLDGQAPIRRHGKWSLINTKGESGRSLEFETIEPYSEGLAVATQNGKMGYLNSSAEIVIPLQFRKAKSFHDGLAAVAKEATDAEKLGILSAQDWQCGYIDLSGRMVIAPQFPGGKIFANGLAPVRIGLKWGYIDTTGSVVIKPTFDEAEVFSEGFAAVRIANRWGYIDKTGRLVIKMIYGGKRDEEYAFDKRKAFIGPFNDGLAAVRSQYEGWNFIDVDGKKLFKNLSFRAIFGNPSFREGLTFASDASGSGYIDRAGRMVVRKSTNYYGPFSEGLAAFYVITQGQGYKIGFINRSGDVVLEPQFKAVDNFHEGFAVVSDPLWSGRGTYNGKYGYIDKSGKVLTGAIFDSADSFSEGLAAVKQGDSWGYIDKEGKFVIGAQFEGAAAFSESLALVKDKSSHHYGFINHEGKQVIPTDFLYASKFSEGLALVAVPVNKSSKK